MGYQLCDSLLITYCSGRLKIPDKYVPDQIGIWKCGPGKTGVTGEKPTTNSNHIWRQNARQNIVFVACIGGNHKRVA